MANPFAGSRFYARMGNVFMQPMWSVLHPPVGFAILTTRGRKSGQPRRQNVRAIREDERVVVVAMMGERAQWLKNARAHPEVTLKLHDGTYRGVAHEVTEPDERAWAETLYVETVVRNDYFDYASYEWAFPGRRAIIEAHRHWFDEGIPVIVEIGSMPGVSP